MKDEKENQIHFRNSVIPSMAPLLHLQGSYSGPFPSPTSGPLPFPLHLGIQVEFPPFPVYFLLPFQAPGTRASPAPLTHGEESEHVFVGAPSFFSVFMVQEGSGKVETPISVSPPLPAGIQDLEDN